MLVRNIAVRFICKRGCREQVEKMGLLTGSRLGTERTVDLDELEVCCAARLPPAARCTCGAGPASEAALELRPTEDRRGEI